MSYDCVCLSLCMFVCLSVCLCVCVQVQDVKNAVNRLQSGFVCVLSNRHSTVVTRASVLLRPAADNVCVIHRSLDASVNTICRLHH